MQAGSLTGVRQLGSLSLSIRWFQTRGDADDMRYNMGEAVMGSINGSPNNEGWMLDLSWLPVQNAKISVRYTSYRQ